METMQQGKCSKQMWRSLSAGYFDEYKFSRFGGAHCGGNLWKHGANQLPPIPAQNNDRQFAPCQVLLKMEAIVRRKQDIKSSLFRGA
jgi:hypothetical protein